jgi:hypothetical protein
MANEFSGDAGFEWNPKVMETPEPINGKWLREVGFKYHPIRKYYYRNTINDTLLVYSSGADREPKTQWYLCAVADHIDPAAHTDLSAMLTGRATREDVLQVVEICERERKEQPN